MDFEYPNSLPDNESLLGQERRQPMQNLGAQNKIPTLRLAPGTF